MIVTSSVKAPKAGPQNKLQIVQAVDLRKVPWLVHGFSTRPGGRSACYGGRSLNLGFTQEDTRGNVEENRRQFLLALGASTRGKAWPLVVNRQVHSDVIHVLREQVLREVPRDAKAGPLAGDGIITNLPGVAIAILTAD